MDGDGKNDLVLYEKGKKPSAGELKGISQVLELGTNITLEHGTYGNIVVNAHIAKTWNESRDYLFPIPITDVTLNPNLGQNPGWEQ